MLCLAAHCTAGRCWPGAWQWSTGMRVCHIQSNSSTATAHTLMLYGLGYVWAWMCLHLYPFAVALPCAAELKKQLLSRRLVNASDILGGTHCLASACIRASLASSLAKLRVDTLDLLYLHNPAEVQLEARGKAGFFEVLRTAFKVGQGGSKATVATAWAGRDLWHDS